MQRSSLIQRAFADPERLDKLSREAVIQTIADLDAGHLRVAEPEEGGWRVHEWIKKAILLAFRLAEMEVMEAGPLEFYDKLPPK